MAGPDLSGLHLVGDLGLYEATVELGGAPVELRVAPELNEDRARLGEILAAVARERERLLNAVVEDLLEDKNEGWLEEGESPLSAEEFRARLALAAVEIRAGGESELVLDDDGMFWGHELVVRLDPALQIVRAGPEG